MWKHFTSELQNGVETLKEDWKGIRENVKTIDVSDFRKYEKKELKLSTKNYTASLQKVVELADLLCGDHDYSTTLAIYKLKVALHDLEDSISDLHGCVVVKGNAEVEEKLFDTAMQNISAAYEVAEEMNELRDTDIYGVIYAIPPHAIDTGLNDTASKRRLINAALYECARNDEMYPW